MIFNFQKKIRQILVFFGTVRKFNFSLFDFFRKRTKNGTSHFLWNKNKKNKNLKRSKKELHKILGINYNIKNKSKNKKLENLKKNFTLKKF